MTCDELTHDQWIAYLDHELDREVFVEMRYHVHSCAACTRRLEEVRGIVRGIAAASDATQPLVPQAMEDALLVEIGKIAAATRGEPAEPRAPVKLRGERRLSGGQVLGAAVAAALLLLALGGLLRNALSGKGGEGEGEKTVAAAKAPEPEKKTAATAKRVEQAPPKKKSPPAPPIVEAFAMDVAPPDAGSAAGELAVVWEEPPAPKPKPVAAPPQEAVVVKPAPPRRKLPGDVNGDGKVDIADSMLITRALVRKDIDLDAAAADVNGDGKVDIADSMAISNQVVAGAR